jgi:hypothetical protein
MFDHILAGTTCMSYLVICMFFVRFWQKTHDRLFLFFTAAFAVFMTERVVRLLMEAETDWAPYVYMIRLSGFILILLAIADKNRRS